MVEELERLARAFSDGADCGFALHDQLIECGFPRQAAWLVHLTKVIPQYRDPKTVRLILRQRLRLDHDETLKSWERDCPNPG